MPSCLKNAGRLLFLCAIVPSALGQAPDTGALSSMVGVYRGEVFNGGDMDPVTTTFTLADQGRLAGGYVVEDETGVLEGTISSVLPEGPNGISFEWTDRFGEGFAVIRFNDSFQRFQGFWGDTGGEAQYPWNGTRQ